MWVDLGELLGVLPADNEWRGGLEVYGGVHKNGSPLDRGWHQGQ